MFIYRSSEFKKRYRASSEKMRGRIEERLNIFSADEFSSILSNHELHGEYAGCRSVNVTGDVRIVYKKLDSNRYLLIIFGTHSQLYE